MSDGRVDRGSIRVAASAAAVYRALVEPDRLVAWLPPDGMEGTVESFDARPGGGYRMVLTYLDPTGAPGKSTADQDVVEVRFAALVPDRLVVEEVAFETEGPRTRRTTAS